MNFNYKKYSLEQLENWVHDVVSGETSPQEIYDVIKGVVNKQYYYHKHHVSRCYELLALLNGNGKGHLSCDKDDPSQESQKFWNDFWEENYYTEEYKDSSVNSDNYYGSPAQWSYKGKSATYDEIVADGWEMTADGFWWKEPKENKVKKWVLHVESNGPSGEYFVTFPDDLLEATNLKEGDQINWIDQGDGSYLLSKINKPIDMEDC